jgi:hypothetical protein
MSEKYNLLLEAIGLFVARQSTFCLWTLVSREEQ